MENQLSQRERVRQELMQISDNVTDEDKRQFIDIHHLTPTTISAYLKGDQSRLETGLKMLLFFRQRIQEREKLINAE